MQALSCHFKNKGNHQHTFLSNVEVLITYDDRHYHVTDTEIVISIVLGSTRCEISSIYDQGKYLQLSHVVLRTIVNHLPIAPIPTSRNDFYNLRLTHGKYFQPGPVDLLLEVDYLLHFTTVNR